MAGKSKRAGGAVGKGGVSPAPRAEDMTVRAAAEQLLMVPIAELVPYAGNARTHSPEQIGLLRRSLREFGFVAPVLIDFDNNIIAGHGRVEAARAEGMTEVPCVLVSNLSDAQRRAYILADNRLAELSGWDGERLRLEMEQLAALRFDTAIIGFDMPAPPPLQFGPADMQSGHKTVHVQDYTRAAPGLVEKVKSPGQDVQPEKTEDYRQFVDKFKPKLTTDDCYTPKNVYEAVRDWAVRRYGLEGVEIVRPFWPGGDYQSAEYSEGCVVIDNPPFSILSEICRWYMERGVRFFLFAPTLTLFSVASGACGYLTCGVTVTYENGANVSTSFVTNLGEYKIEVSPDLHETVKEANDRNLKGETSELPTYAYPPEVASAGTLLPLARRGQGLYIRAEDAAFVRVLDSQKAEGKAIFGGGFLLSEKAAAEKAAAEKAAAEKAAAVKWQLSEREMEIVKSLGRRREDAGTETAYGSDCGQGEKAPEQDGGGGAAEP